MIDHTLTSNELVLKIKNDIISTHVEAIQEQLDSIIENPKLWNENWDMLTIDMTNLRMIDSLGLNLLVRLIKRAKLRNGEIRAHITSRSIYQTLLATRMDKMMTLHLKE